MADAATKKLISFVIPARDEEGDVGRVVGEICAVAAEADLSIEIVVVDDGSRDGTWDRIGEAARADARVRGIRLRRNFGKAAALTAGFQAARGDLVFMLDADGQDDPAEIPQFLAKIDEGYDCVSGWKQHRVDPWHKTLPSRVFNRLVSALTDVRLHDHNCGFKCYRAAVLKEIRIYGERHRFIPVLADARGFRVAEVPVHHRPRLHGRSKYGVERLLKGFLDLLTVCFLTGYSQRPAHVLGTFGLISFAFGTLSLTALAGFWVLQRFATNPQAIGNRPLLIYALGALLLGAQLLSLGFLAELVTAHNMPVDAPYSVAETTDAVPTANGDA